MRAKQRIGVLSGGLSAQRASSIRSGEAIVDALEQSGHRASLVFVDREVDLVLRQQRIDVAFVALRGRYGGDGCVQGLLELFGIPYTGSGLLASALGMNRVKAKEILRLHNLPTLPAYTLDAEAGEDVREAHRSLGFPAVVRPASAGPGVGASLARDSRELDAAVEHALRFDDEVLVERAFEGRVVSFALLHGSPIGAADLGPLFGGLARGGRDVKHLERAVEATPRLSVARHQSLMRLAASVGEAIGLEGAALVDLIVSERANEAVFEVDAAPALVPGGLYARIAEGAGVPFTALVEEILSGARLRAHGRRRERRKTQILFEGPERRAGLVPSTH